jgi:hypothetical protein
MGEAAGIRVRAYDLTGGDLGAVHLPLPVLVGDIVAFDEGLPHEIVAVLHADDGRPVGVRARPVRLRPKPR